MKGKINPTGIPVMHPSQFISSPEGYTHKMNLELCSRHGNRVCLDALWGYFLRNKSCAQAVLPNRENPATAPSPSTLMQSKLSCLHQAQNLGDLLGNQAPEVHGRKRSLEKKNPTNKHSEWELKDLKGKIWTSFIHSGQVLFT